MIAVLLSIWIFIFAFIIRPFDDGTLSLTVWVLMSFGFAAGAFVAYAIVAIIQNKVYLKITQWNLSLEIASLVLFLSLYLIITFTYYKSPILNGGYTFFEFLSNIFIKASSITLPIIIFARKYVLSFIPKQEKVLTIRGENKLDVLKINKKDLICISNAQNYVEVFYRNNEQLNTKLIRSSLKKIAKEIDILIQVHRSHLINPAHFKCWKNSKTVSLTFIDIPVSQKYKSKLSSL